MALSGLVSGFADVDRFRELSTPHHLLHIHSPTMPISLSSIVEALPADDNWGPPTTTESLVEGVPYAPYSKGDKLGRCADWTVGEKDQRGERRQYNRNYRGKRIHALA